MALSSLRGGIFLLCGFAVVSTGCLISTPEREPVDREPSMSRHLSKAQSMYDSGQYEDALKELVDVSYRHPQATGLDDLRFQVMAALSEQQQQTLSQDVRQSRGRMILDVDRSKVLPDTYGMWRYFPGDMTALRSKTPISSAAQEMLNQKITMHLEEADLNAFILAVGASENINIVADSGLGMDQYITIRADNVPFREILDYAARNFGVVFYAGENMVWATALDVEPPDTPLETRMYPLRKGLSGRELPDLRAIGDNVTTDTNANDIKTSIELAMERLVPSPDDEFSDEWFLFDHKTHVLIARNSRENLALVEDLIEYLDVCPPQILIEARFISTSVSDLHELGIDWLLNSPMVLSRRPVTIDGRTIDAPRTQIAAGSGFPYTPSEDGDGLTMTYQGLLTKPMFDAVLYALRQSGKAQTLSAPKITTVNNRNAIIRVGKDFRYFEEYALEPVPIGRDALGQIQYTERPIPVGSPILEPLGITLSVTPSVGADLESITLRLAPWIREFIRYEYYDTAREDEDDDNERHILGSIRLPIFRTHEIETEVIVRSGETVVMGGLITQSDQADEKSVPVLSSIPLIGRLFKSDGSKETKQNLLIFVTANLISQRGEDLLPVHTPEISQEDSIRREFFPTSVDKGTEIAPQPRPAPQPPNFDDPPE